MTYTRSYPFGVGGLIPVAGLTNAEVAAAAAIAYSKLALTGTIVNADVAAAAAVAYSKLALTGTIVNADVATAAVLARSKLATTGVGATEVSLGFDTTRQPSATQDILVVSTGHVVLDKTEDGTVNLNVSVGSPAVGIVAAWRGVNGDTNVIANAAQIPFTLVAIVPRGYYYQIATASNVGTPAFTLSTIWEIPL